MSWICWDGAGILTLDVHDVTKREAALLTAAIDKGVQHHGKPSLPELDVAVTATVWGLSIDAHNSAVAHKQAQTGLPAVLAPAFDVTVRADHGGSLDEEMADIDYVFEQGADDNASSASMERVVWELQHHITAACLLPSPAMTEGSCKASEPLLGQKASW